MPTFTAIALDRFIEPRSRIPPPPPPPVNSGKRIPALYATPESTPLPDSPSSFPPSPFIINHKRRGPRLLKSLSQNDVGGRPSPLPPVTVDVEQKDVGGIEIKGVGDGEDVGDGVAGAGAEELGNPEDDDFFDLRDSMSTVSNESSGNERLWRPSNESSGNERLWRPSNESSGNERLWKPSNESSGNERLWKPSTPTGEFFDAFDEIASDSTPKFFSRHVEDELREMRMSVLMEIERRKQAEETLETLRSQWQRLSHQLSLVGLVLPIPPVLEEEKDGQSNLEPAEELCQQIVIARLVANSIGRACSRAEIEQEIELLIESKNFEIARLWDRLQYYETANREMSQRNQEAVEMARQRRHRRKRRQRWLWGSIGLGISLGASAVAWYYLPHSKPPSSDESCSAASRGNLNTNKS